MSGLAVLAGLLGGSGIVVLGGPHRRAGALAGRRGAAAPGCGRPPNRLLRVRRTGAGRGDARLAGALVEVAALLRAGTAPADAWSRVLGLPVVDRVPTVRQLAALVGAARRARGSPPPLDAVVAAARVADELGAPLAGVLDQVAAAIAAQAEAAAEVDAALSGPRASARVLVWLPALGVALGAALGADPVGALLGGGLGTAAGVVGLALVVAGRAWSGALLRRAERVGGPG